jgi:lipoprotein-releasing system ATP-binding protein
MNSNYLDQLLSTPPRLGALPGSVALPPAPVAPARRHDDELPQTAPARTDAAHSSPPMAEAVHVRKSYHKGRMEVPVLRDVSLTIQPGEFLAIVGQSGSGKSTLLHLLGTLDAPDSGAVRFQGRRVDNAPAATRDALRNLQLGMIFQFYHLLPELSTLENVLVPAMIAEGFWRYCWRRAGYRAAAAELLNSVGLGHRLTHRPSELSGGEMQRAAIARALITRPKLLLADEPTGNLDQDTGWEIMRILRTLNREQNLTIVMVTHDRVIAEQADRIVRLVDGRIDG